MTRGMKGTDHGHLGQDDEWMKKHMELRGTHPRPGEAGAPTANLENDVLTVKRGTTRNAQTIGQILTSGEWYACFEHKGLEISDSLCGNFTSGGGTQVP